MNGKEAWQSRAAYPGSSVPGVAEVAGFGGFEKQYQVTIDPVKLQGFGLGVMEISEAIYIQESFQLAQP